MVTVPNGKIEVSKDGVKLGWNILSVIAAVGIGWYITAAISPLENAINNLNSTLSKIEARQEADTRTLSDKQIICTQNMIQVQSTVQSLIERVRRAEDLIDARTNSKGMSGMGSMGEHHNVQGNTSYKP